jgi:cytochrome c-type biogenesis protein CcsB
MQWAQLSDQLLTATVLLYALAMLGYAVEYAFGARGAVGRSVARTLVSVGAGGGADRDDTTEPEQADVESANAEPGRPGLTPEQAALAGKAALALTVLGALTQAGCLLARGLAAHRVPWGNMYEFVIAICLVGVLAWLVVAFTRPVRHLGVFVTVTVVLLLGVAAIRLYTDAGPLVPALNSYWLKIHVTAAIVATGILLTGFVSAAMFLIRDRYDRVTAEPGSRPDGLPYARLRFPVTLGDRLPDAETLERLTFRLHALAFPIWTFAIMAGAIWAEEAWTRYWGWDPKETWAFISWVVYAAYLHARATAGWRRSTAAWIAVAGWATMLVNLFVVNLVISGLHSYSGA